MTITKRKDEHLDIVLQNDIEHTGTNLLECVQLFHQSLPELHLDDISLSMRIFSKSVRAPILITGMTGGSDRARDINRKLAEMAESTGVLLGVGSMRPALQDNGRLADYDVRERAPQTPLLGNLGVTQARDIPTAEINDLLKTLDYNALCIHLNPAQELAQAEGDRDFVGCVDAIERYQEELNVPLIVKETGAGMSPQTLNLLSSVGVMWVDVSGTGGTSWTKVESERPSASDFGLSFGDWGIPTAASTAWAVRRGFRTICSGGLRTTLDMLRALALGAKLVGAARPILIALEQDQDQAEALLQNWINDLKRGLLLCGARRPGEVNIQRKVIHPTLQRWIDADAT